MADKARRLELSIARCAEEINAPSRTGALRPPAPRGRKRALAPLR